VDDQGFDFRRSEPRREPKAFEPPPWEAEAFEQLKAVRPEQEEPEAEPGPELKEAPAEEAGPAADATSAEGAQASAAAASKEEAPAASLEDDERVAQMFARLSIEERGSTELTAQVAYVAGSVVGAIGLIFAVWGVVLTVMAGPESRAATMGAELLVFLGLGLIAVAVWMIVRTLRQRGVL
jgi:hypothetical protein